MGWSGYEGMERGVKRRWRSSSGGKGELLGGQGVGGGGAGVGNGWEGKE